MIMKRILILIIGLIGVAYGQSSPTSAKTRFVNGIYLGTKLDAYFNAADSNAIYWRADSVVMAKYKGTARALAFAVSGGYLPILDTATMLSGYKTYYPRTAISAGTGISYNAATGVITNSSPSSGGTVTSVATNNGSGITGGTITSTGTIAADTTILSTKANVNGLLVGYTATGRFLDSLTNVQSRIQTKQPLGNYLTFADSSTILAGRWLPNRSSDSIAVIRALANTKQPIGNYLTFADSSTILAGRWLPNRSADSIAVIRALANTKGVGTVTSVAASAGTGISVSGSPITSSGTITITNTAPDQTVTLNNGTGISVTGTYPNFTVTNSSPSSGGTVTSVSAGIGMSFTTITSTGAVNADTTTLSTRAYAAGLDVGKANTSLNNVNGVLSSTYGGAGIINGILKANGSGVVSAAVAGTDYVAPSALSGYLPLTAGSGNTLSGTLFLNNSGGAILRAQSSGTTAAYSYYQTTGGIVLWGIDGSAGGATFIGASPYASVFGTDSPNPTEFATNNNIRYSISGTGNHDFKSGTATFGAQINGTSAAFSGATQLATSSGRVLIKTTTDNGTDALQVAGSGLFTGAITASSSVTASAFFSPNQRTYLSSGSFRIESVNNTIDMTVSSTAATITTNYYGGGANVPLTISTYGNWSQLVLNTNGSVNFSHNTTSTGFIKSGGTSTQALIADGSVLGISNSGGANTLVQRDASGNLTAVGFFESSDRRLKNIISRDGDVAYFKWKDGSDNKTHIGYIAQEVQKKNPDQVKADDKGFLSVNYTEVLVEKVRALEKKIEELEKRMK